MKRNLLFFLLLFVALDICAQDSVFLSLDVLIQKVETTYPEVLKYQSKIDAYAAKSEGASALMAPTFSVGLNRFPYNLQNMAQMTPENQAGLMFSFDQMITNPQKLKAKKQYYQSLGNAEAQKAEWMKNELRTFAKLFYYQRQVAEQKLKVIDESEQLLNLFIRMAEDRYKYNQSESSTIFKAKARLEETKNMRLMQESMIAESNIGINTLLSRDLTVAFKIDTLFVLNPETLFADTLSRSDINAMKSMIASMQKEQQYMATFSKPDFGVQVQHMQMFGMPNQFSLMGMVTVPIVPWSSKMYNTEVKAMQLEIESSQREVETMELMIAQMQAEKLSMLQYSKKQIANYQNNILPAYQKNMEATLFSYRQNTVDLFVLLDAWEMLLMKKMEMFDVYAATLKLQAEYEKEIEKK